MKNKKTEVFISYRRTEGWELARLVYQSLTQNHYSVFFDIEKLFKGKFGGSIKEKLIEAKVFILILTRDTLARCVTEADKDWVRAEILTAFEKQKEDKDQIIIALKDKEFKMPKGIDKEFLSLVKTDSANNRYCFDISKENYQETIDKVCSIMVKSFKETVSREEIVDDVRTTSNAIKITSKKSYLTQADLNNWIEILGKEWKNDKDVIDNTADGQTAELLKQNVLFKLNKQSELNVLEVGAFDISLGWKFLAKNKDVISNYVFTSCSLEACQILNSVYQYIKKPKAKALTLHPEGKTYVDDLNKVVKTIGNKFDLIIVNQSLTYYKNSNEIIKQLKNVLTDDGAIVILNNDEALNFCYPDENLAIRQFNMLKQDWNKDVYGNIHTGREIYGYLINNGFSDVSLTTKCYSEFFKDNSADTTFKSKSYEWNDTFFEKKMHFYYEFNQLKNYYESCKRGEKEAGAKLKLLADLEDTLLKTYCSTKTFNVKTLLICSGFKTKK